MRLAALKVDRDRVEGGVWKAYVDEDSGFDYGLELCTRPIGNPDYMAMVSDLEREARDPLTGEVDEKAQATIHWRAVIHTCFVDWRGSDGTQIEGEDGGEIAWTPDLGETIFDPENGDKGYMHIFFAWVRHARRMQDFLAGSVGATGKKSVPSSNGSSPTERPRESLKPGIDRMATPGNSLLGPDSDTSNL